MATVLFVVAREQAELVGHLTHEFPEGDVRVLLDRRHRERRLGAAPPAHDRRGGERRSGHTGGRELRSLGYSIVRLEGAADAPAPGRRLVNATAARQVEGYLREHFRYYTTVPSGDRVHEGQAFVLIGAQGRAAHRVVFTKEFLDYYGVAMPDRIPKLLDEWKLIQRLELAGRQSVVVSSYGVRLVDD